MRWEVIRLSKGLDSYYGAWDALNLKLFANHPYYSSHFVNGLLKHFGNGKEYLCAHRSKAGHIDGLLILQYRNWGKWALFLPPQAQIMPVMVSDTASIFSLFRDLPYAGSIEIEALNQDPAYSTLLAGSKGQELLQEDQALTISVELSGEFSDYWSCRSKNLKKNIKRYFRRVEQNGHSLSLVMRETKTDMSGALQRYGDIESSGWKADSGSAIHISNEQGAFYLEVLESFSTENRAVVYELFLGSTLIASRLCLRNQRMLIILKTSYDENYATYAPGKLLLYLVLEREFEIKQSETVEFYTDATSEQITWSTHQRRIRHVLLFRNSAIQAIYQGQSLLRQNLRDLHSKDDALNNAVMQNEVFSSMDLLPDYYAKLFDKSEQYSFDMGLEWFRLLEKLGFDRESAVQVYGQKTKVKNTPTVLLPLCRNPNDRKLTALANYYTSRFSPILSPNSSRSELAELLRYVRQESKAVSLTLAPLCFDSTNYEEMYSALKDAGWNAYRYFCFGNWYLPVEGRSYEQIYRTMPSALRHTIERKKRKFFNRENGRLKIVTEKESLPNAIIDYAKIYNSSWKSAEPSPDFIVELMHLFANRGELRLGLAYVGDQPAAAQIWITTGGRAAIYKLAYDKRFGNLSVGTILTDALMRQSVDVDKVSQVDYLNGDEPYKKDWMSHRRERWGIVAYNSSSLMGNIEMLAEELRLCVKIILRKIRA